MSLQYYDLVLIGILSSILTGALIGTLVTVEMVVSVVVTSMLAILLIIHALFVRGPVDRIEDLTDEVTQIGPIELSE